MPTKLPTFKGYTVDERLREFRKVEFGKSIKFIRFDSAKGRKLLTEYTLSLVSTKQPQPTDEIPTRSG